jgi:hypothetical protein
MSYQALLIGIYIFLAAGGAVQATDNSTALMHPGRLKGLAELKGKIERIDESGHRIMLVDSSNQKVTVIAAPDTVVTDAGGHAFSWTSLRAGDPVWVYYEPKDHVALQIDRRSTAAESVLGIEHPETPSQPH